MQKQFLRSVLFCVGSLTVPGAAQASLVVSNLNEASEGQSAFSGPNNQFAAPFSLGASFTPADLESVTLRLVHDSLVAIDVSLWSNAGSLPGSQLADLGSLAFQDNGPLWIDYTFTPLSPLTLQPGMIYWIVLDKVAGNSSSGVGWSMVADDTLDPGSNPAASIPPDWAWSFDNGTTWSLSPAFNLQFQFSVHAVPEPETLALVATACLFSIRRRRQG